LEAHFGYRAGSFAVGRAPGGFALEASVVSAAALLVEVRLVALVEVDLVFLAADC
jgi:hypothetical protein